MDLSIVLLLMAAMWCGGFCIGKSHSQGGATMPEELTLVDLGAELAKAAALVAAMTRTLEFYQKVGTLSDIEGCKQTLNAALAALDGYVSILRHKTNAPEEA